MACKCLGKRLFTKLLCYVINIIFIYDKTVNEDSSDELYKRDSSLSRIYLLGTRDEF